MTWQPSLSAELIHTKMKLLDLLIKNDNYVKESGGYPNTHGTDKEYLHGHHYVSSFYEEHFEKYKDLPITLLEIGIQYGGSLLLWKDYFAKANIIGVDIEDKVNKSIMEQFPQITRHTTNAYSADFANSLPRLDIVIDDGPHTLDSFIQCIDLYLPKINPGGLLVIEDIPSIGHVSVLKQKIGSLKHLTIDTREQYKRFDNILFAIFK